MKRYYFQILLACCLTLFAGCSDSDSESGQNGIPKGSKAIDPVSYTHLTLPTILLV